MLEGRLVRLRAIENGDLLLFVKWINDPDVSFFLQFEPPMSLEDEATWYHHMLNSRDKVFAIETREGRLIGNIGLVGLDWRSRKTDIGIMIGEKDAWSQGYGTDAITVLLRYLFEELNLNRVGLYTDATNLRALRCYEKCGFVREGVVRQHRFSNGRYIDSVQMSVLRQDWEAGKGISSSDQ
ncbi:MAG: GNAT family N-acetyltransferase [Methanomassiliicoccus sp.]|nr:GNAT family N-acetyltransferase [Methanomassiliicoccus sp.]